MRNPTRRPGLKLSTTIATSIQAPETPLQHRFSSPAATRQPDCSARGAKRSFSSTPEVADAHDLLADPVAYSCGDWHLCGAKPRADHPSLSPGKRLLSPRAPDGDRLSFGHGERRNGVRPRAALASAGHGASLGLSCRSHIALALPRPGVTMNRQLTRSSSGD